MIYHGEFIDVLEMVTKASNYCFATGKNGNEEAILRSATEIYIEQMRECANSSTGTERVKAGVTKHE